MLKSVFTWYRLLCKRLLNKVSFLLILLLIPAFALLVSLAAKDNSGFVRIALAAEDREDIIANEIINDLKDNTSFLTFVVYEDYDDAIMAVENSKVDTAWIFPSDMKNRIIKFAKGDRNVLAKVFVKEDDMLVKSAREKLFGALYGELSYEIYKDYVLDLNLDATMITDDKLFNTYEVLSGDDGVVAVEFSDSTPVDLKSYNYTTAPLRGLLVTVMVLCGLAATLYYLEDEKRHTFANLSSSKRFWVFLGNNLAAISISAVFVFVSILLSGNFTDFGTELVTMLFFVLTTTIFTVFVGCITKSSATIGIVIPIILVFSITLCPIFFNINLFTAAQSILPQYLYLYSVGDIFKYILPMLIYILIGLPLSYGIFKLKKR